MLCKPVMVTNLLEERFVGDRYSFNFILLWAITMLLATEMCCKRYHCLKATICYICFKWSHILCILLKYCEVAFFLYKIFVKKYFSCDQNMRTSRLNRISSKYIVRSYKTCVLKLFYSLCWKCFIYVIANSLKHVVFNFCVFNTFWNTAFHI